MVVTWAEAADFIKGMAEPFDWVVALAKFHGQANKPAQVGLFIRCSCCLVEVNCGRQSSVFSCLCCTSALDVCQMIEVVS